MENQWEKDWHKRYHAVLKAANGVTYVSNKPGRAAFFKRNEWMVDNSKRLRETVYQDLISTYRRGIKERKEAAQQNAQ